MGNKPDLIFTSDWHLRTDVPKCRTDNFINTLIGKVEFIRDLSNEHNIPVVIAGDLGERPIRSWTPRLIRTTIDLLNGFNNEVYIIPGQHDLPNHDVQRIGDSGLGALISAQVVSPLFFDKLGTIRAEIVSVNKNTIELVGFSFNAEIKDIDMFENKADRKIAVVHTMVINDKKLWAQQSSYSLATHMLRKYDYDCIVSGDNHNPFVTEYKGKILVNCGSLSRQRSDQIHHKPRVYLYYAETNTVEPVYIPIDPDAVSVKFRNSEVEQDERLERYVEALDVDYEVGLKFEDNLRTNLDVNKDVPDSVRDKVWEAYESSRKQAS